jgi:glycosyltransferase involved in cell wall biosynthesis
MSGRSMTARRLVLDALDRSWTIGGVSSYIDAICRTLPEPPDVQVQLLWPHDLPAPPVPPHVQIRSIWLPRYARRVVRLLVISWLITRRPPRFWLALTTILPLRVPRGVRTGVVLHDVRHLDLPHQFSRAQRIWRAMVWHRALDRADVVVAISRFSLSRVAAHLGPLRGELVHVPHGVDVPGSSDAGSSDANAERTRDVVLAFGHWQHKRPDWAIEAFARCDARSDSAEPWMLAITGIDVTRRASYQEQAERLGIADQVEVHGYLDDDRYHQLWARVGVVLLPSMYEGFGLPVIEALARGLPVAAWDVTAVAELAGLPGVHLARPWDLDDLAEQLAKALSPAARRHAKAGRDIVVERTWKSVAAELLAAMLGEQTAPTGADTATGTPARGSAPITEKRPMDRID